MIVSQGEQFHLIESVEILVVIVDFGEWYHISFGKKFCLGRFVCQKDF